MSDKVSWVVRKFDDEDEYEFLEYVRGVLCLRRRCKFNHMYRLKGFSKEIINELMILDIMHS